MALLTLADAKAQLNLTSDAEDAELQVYVEAVTEVVEFFIGPVEPRQVTEQHDAGGGRPVLVLRTSPVLSVTSVGPVLTGGVTYPVDGLAVDPLTGQVRRRDGGWFCGLLEVVVQAGRASVSPTINLAARMLVQHLWRTQRAGRRGAIAGGGDDYSVSEPIPGLGYAVPYRVLELLQPYRLPPGVA
ncbi:phage gp6-like head-tail connector protein [Streptomyces longwoodensis]|uniref:head-tail connector protein n=1 Tax=Streptomyces longwoodensis TaxID=68231 RepID=UPI002DDA3D8B|nr:head-tail connector protein [Streptomyces longwoodensis]WRY88810.1 phage gp6-like head-tail connector protein [Streptomyces longwoodensis]